MVIAVAGVDVLGRPLNVRAGGGACERVSVSVCVCVGDDARCQASCRSRVAKFVAKVT